MAKKELYIESGPDIHGDDAFVRHFQSQLLLFLKQRGKLTETQYKNGLRLLQEKRP
ncbi:hypothetical protein SAMN02745823_00075 [Sporobacter termitidis DSM 10068]|uniref:Uncharacterized protein n=1 Tax=Sporobacter termitidis DSM 10068 TaxID=1123282 RepID=A0A1M5TFT2_9FIRM|nr:hypothetical protein [Sporobacter termitidis]SHH49554.1 hypothetical protein SAMN02745823_00075 [Sporobacter termitidis DSM 10068]